MLALESRLDALKVVAARGACTRRLFSSALALPCITNPPCARACVCHSRMRKEDEAAAVSRDDASGPSSADGALGTPDALGARVEQHSCAGDEWSTDEKALEALSRRFRAKRRAAREDTRRRMVHNSDSAGGDASSGSPGERDAARRAERSARRRGRHSEKSVPWPIFIY